MWSSMWAIGPLAGTRKTTTGASSDVRRGLSLYRHVPFTVMTLHDAEGYRHDEEGEFSFMTQSGSWCQMAIATTPLGKVEHMCM